MKRLLTAAILRFLPAVQPPVVVPAPAGRGSVRRAWDAVSASVASCLPGEMPSLSRLSSLSRSRLPTFTLPKLSLPAMQPFGRFISSLPALMLAPGQLQSLAVCYHVVTGELTPSATEEPVSWIAANSPETILVPAAAPVLVAPATRVHLASATSVRSSSSTWAKFFPSVVLTEECAPVAPAPRFVSVASPLRSPLGVICADAWLEETERGQRPPPVLV